MAKVITFSRQFPKGHPRAGEPTYFVEKVLTSLLKQGIYTNYQSLLLLNQDKINDTKSKLTALDVSRFWDSLHKTTELGSKPHTIRSGHRWKAGDMASLRVWSGIPYNSPQIIFAPDVEIKKVYHFEIDENPPGYTAHINSKPVYSKNLSVVANSDGLSYDDFKSWFKWGKQEFHGQIICWGEVNY
jgi:hypothetical protein